MIVGVYHKMPKISVIIPVYKVEPYLRRCIDSVLYQSYSDFEVLLVDDGSPDECGRICDEYLKIDTRIHSFHKENGGLSSARNYGLEWVLRNSDAEWITFIDSDDWVHFRYLELLHNAAIEKKVNIVVGGYYETRTDKIVDKTITGRSILVNARQLFVNHYNNATVAWGKLYRRKCFKEIRFPIGKAHEDEFTTYKLLFSESVLGYISEPIYYYYYNVGSITKQPWSPARLDGTEAFLERIFFFVKKKDAFMTHHSLNMLFSNLSWQINVVEKSEIADSQKIAKTLKRKYICYSLRLKKYMPIKNYRKVYIKDLYYAVPEMMSFFLKIRHRRKK